MGIAVKFGINTTIVALKMEISQGETHAITSTNSSITILFITKIRANNISNSTEKVIQV